MRARGWAITLIMSCIFCANGVAMPFLPQWLADERGLVGAQIGAVLSSAQLCRIGIGPLIAVWADGFADRRIPLRLLACGALVSYIAFFSSRDFLALLLTGFCALAFSAAMTPLMEGAALRAARDGGMAFGPSRGIGSLAFIFGNLGGGALVARFGLTAATSWILTAVAGAAGAALLLVKPDPAPQGRSGFRARMRLALPLLRNRRFALALAATGLTQAAHGFYYGFSTLAWSRQGLDAATIGALWAFGVACEVAVLFSLSHAEKRLTPEALVLIGAGAAVVLECDGVCAAAHSAVAVANPARRHFRRYTCRRAPDRRARNTAGNRRARYDALCRARGGHAVGLGDFAFRCAVRRCRRGRLRRDGGFGSPWLGRRLGDDARVGKYNVIKSAS